MGAVGASLGDTRTTLWAFQLLRFSRHERDMRPTNGDNVSTGAPSHSLVSPSIAAWSAYAEQSSVYQPGLHKHVHAPDPVQAPFPEQAFVRSTHGTGVGAGVRAVGAIEGSEAAYLGSELQSSLIL